MLQLGYRINKNEFNEDPEFKQNNVICIVT